MEGKVWGTNEDSCGSKSEQSKYRHLEVWMMKSLSAGCVNIVSTCDYF